jgi:ribosome maturation factor RimP
LCDILVTVVIEFVERVDTESTLSALIMRNVWRFYMATEKVTDIVYNMALPLAKERGLSIYEVEFKKEGSDKVLRVILDTQPGSEDTAFVSINDCEEVSRRLSDMLDEKDPISEVYMLEVTSPGLDRPLKKAEDFIRFCGHSIDIGLYKAVNGSKVVTGILDSYNDGDVTVTLANGEKITIVKKDISSVKLTVIF